jgi:predicted hydrocarbon binding protein
LQGLLYHYFRDFVEQRLGAPLWERARQRAGVPERSFVLTRVYPDRYVHDLLAAIREELGAEAPPPDELLFEFGRHVGRAFERDFDFYFRRFVSAHDMIAGIEPVIHAEVRRHNPHSQPPALRTSPAPGGGLRLIYTSPRALCDLLRGLAVQVGEAYGERVEIQELRCRKRGDEACEFLFSFSRIESPRSDASPP